MPPPYMGIPTRKQWDDDVGRSARGSPVVKRIGELLDLYYGQKEDAQMLRLELVFQLYRHSRWLASRPGSFAKKSVNWSYQLSNGTKTKERGAGTVVKEKLGADFDAKVMDAADSVRVVTQQVLVQQLDLGDEAGEEALEQALIQEWGRQVEEDTVERDARSVAAGDLVWFDDEFQRRCQKLSFREGMAYRWSNNSKTTLALYDTHKAGHEVEYQGSLYAMSAGKGRIYVLGDDPNKDIVHASMLGGRPVAAAGTLRVEKGQVVWATANSGHYRPEVKHMINLLERLWGYGVRLDRVTVYRQNFTVESRPLHKGLPSYFEPCDALRLLQLRHWPCSDQAIWYTMKVGDPRR